MLSLFLGLLLMVFLGVGGLVGALLLGLMLAVLRMNQPKPVPPAEATPSVQRPYDLPSEPVQVPVANTAGKPAGTTVAEVKEHFVNGGDGTRGGVQGIEEPMGHSTSALHQAAGAYSGPNLPEYTPPTARNLFMNILLDEYKYHPNRPEAADVDHPAVKQAMDDYFRVQWFSDPTDVFGKSQNQRQFITQPSTTVPNQQGEFADWLYRIPGKTCKEGGRPACVAGTDGGALPWLSHSS